MNKLTRKLMISVFTLAFALVTLGATTFAWFTLTSVSSIDEVEVEIIAGNFMELSIDGSVYKNRITASELLAKIIERDGEEVARMDAVTTEDGVNFVDRDNNEVTGYLSFKLWIRSTAAGSKVYLSNNTTISSDPKPWTSDVDFNYRNSVNQNETINVYAADAFRISFQEFSDAHTTQKDGTTPIIFELDSNNPDNMPLGSTLNATEGLLSYWEAKMEEVLELPDGFTLPAVKTTDDLGINVNDEPIVTIATLEDDSVDNDYVYGYVMVRMWIEGWDPDSFDAILNKSVKVQFEFSLVSPEA